MLRLNEIYRHNDARNYNITLIALCLFVGLITFWASSLFRIGIYLGFGIFMGALLSIGYFHTVKESRKNSFLIDFRHIGFLLGLGIIVIVIGVLV